MNDPMKNPDTDEQHRRRREAGSDEDDPDGQEVARRLYSTPYETEPTPDEDGATEPQ
jgi:hypothetical protein